VLTPLASICARAAPIIAITPHVQAANISFFMLVSEHCFPGKFLSLYAYVLSALADA
jgi:hypothetical protein